MLPMSMAEGCGVLYAASGPVTHLAWNAHGQACLLYVVRSGHAAGRHSGDLKEGRYGICYR